LEAIAHSRYRNNPRFSLKARILGADSFGLPVSTTHVLTSGVAGTMAANRAGLQWGTLRALAAAWLLTLPASIALAGGLFLLFRHVV